MMMMMMMMMVELRMVVVRFPTLSRFLEVLIGMLAMLVELEHHNYSMDKRRPHGHHK